VLPAGDAQRDFCRHREKHFMAQLVTQAHRVSSIHARYSKIHSALFSISPFKKKSLRGDNADTTYSEFEAELSEMAQTLSEIGATIRDSAELDPNTSYSRKFAVILQQYIEELSTSIIRVLQICKQRHRSKLGEEAYDSEQSREDLTKYDQSIQNHKRLGIKLSRMAPRL
jgi:hypothetical protein